MTHDDWFFFQGRMNQNEPLNRSDDTISFCWKQKTIYAELLMCDEIDNKEVGNDHQDNASLNFGLLKTIGFPIKSDQFVSFINFE